MKPIYIDLIRHGKVAGEAALYGHTDVLLKSGEIADLTRQLHGNPIPYQQLISSPMRRCLDFSKVFAQAQQLEMTIDARCKEYSFGELDGQPFARLNKQQRHTLDLFWQFPASVLLPQAEDYDHFSQRIYDFLQSLFSQAKQDGNVLVVCHGGVIKAILAQLLAMPLGRAMQHLHIEYGSLTRIQFWQNMDDARVLFSGARTL